MQVLNFTIPVSDAYNVIVQKEEANTFYPHLHRHAEAQLTWIVEGEGTLVVNSTIQPFKNNSIFYIGANQQHLFKSDSTYFNKNSKKKVEAITIFFNPDGGLKPLFELAECKALLNFIKEFEGGFLLPTQATVKFTHFFIKLLQCTASKRLLLFLELLHSLRAVRKIVIPFDKSQASKSVSDAEGKRMSEIYRFVFEHYHKDIRLEEIAAVVNFTVPAFCRYIKKRTKKTFITFLNEVRISHACQMLGSNSFDGIATIAYQTGFNSVVHFNRVFKAVMKQRPTDYLKSYHQSVGNENW